MTEGRLALKVASLVLLPRLVERVGFVRGSVTTEPQVLRVHASTGLVDLSLRPRPLLLVEMLRQIDAVRLVSILPLAMVRLLFSLLVSGRLTEASAQETLLRALKLVLLLEQLVLLLPDALVVIGLLGSHLSSHAGRSLSLIANST